MEKGKLIIIESGSDGSGKATQTKLLFDRLLKDGYKIRNITFPNYKSESSSLVKMYLRGDFGNKPEEVNPYATSTFFAVDRYASFKTDWESFYNDGGIIISDRYTTSNMVHQASKMDKRQRDEFLDWLYELEFSLYGLPVPDSVIFLDLPPALSQKLIKNRPNKITGEEVKDIHENDIEYLKRSYQHSLYVVEKYNWIRIPCNNGNQIRSIEEIHRDVYNIVKEKLED